MMQLKNEIHTIAVGAAIGQACLLLAAGFRGKRSMMPHAKAMIQQPRVPSSELIPANDVLIRAKEDCQLGKPNWLDIVMKAMIVEEIMLWCSLDLKSHSEEKQDS